MTDLAGVARLLFASGKGILAADESPETSTKRFSALKIPSSPEMRRQYRDLFLGCPGIEEYLSGVILHEETLMQKGNAGVLFPLSLAARDIAPGIKVDGGTEPVPESPDEVITKGLLGLSERLSAYKKQGAVFTKWRAVICIDGDRLPTSSVILENAKRLASYAKDAQTQGLVPIVEPEVLHEGSHARKRAKEVMKDVYDVVFRVLHEQSVDLGTLILKSSMVISGDKNSKQDTPEEVAEDTFEVLMASVPEQVAGIVFLSGGQSPDEATANLAAIAWKAREAKAPWPLTFSFARALQDEAEAIWLGKEENVAPAREAFLARLGKVAAAMRQ